jgi:hypothetical protein
MPTADPTANTTSPPVAKTGRRSTRKRAAAGTSAARRVGSAARKSTRAKAATRRRSSSAARKTTSRNGSAADRSAGPLADYAERAILIPLGAALIARERVASSVSDTILSYTSTTKAQAQLRRFERRGITARKRLERNVRKVRVRVERELRHRRREIEKTVDDLEERRDAVAKNSTELANRVQERLLSLV